MKDQQTTLTANYLTDIEIILGKLESLRGLTNRSETWKLDQELWRAQIAMQRAVELCKTINENTNI